MAKRRTKSTTALLRVGGKPSSVAALPGTPLDANGKRLKLVAWGEGDNLPQECLRVVYDSGTAEACASRLAQFIGGKGFAAEATANMRANDEQTLNDLLAEAKHYAALGLGVAVVVRYTYGGQRGDVYVEPADCLRRAKDGGFFVVNYGLAMGLNKPADNRVYLPYDALASEAEIAEQVAEAASSEAGYWGHLLFSFEARPGRTNYPVPGYYAAKEDLETDAALARYERKQALNGFYPDAVMTVVGQKYEAIPDEQWVLAEGQTEDDRPVDESPDLEDLKKNIKAMKGSESESSVLLLTAGSQDELPDLKFIEKGPNSKGMTDMRARIVSAVCRHMGVPPELIGVATPGVLGNNQQIVNLINLFNLTVEDRRAGITTPLARLFPELSDWSVKQLKPVDYIDPIVAAQLTADEIRAFGGFAALEKPQSTESEKTLQAVTGLSPIVATKVLNSMTTEEIRALVGLPATDQPLAAPTPDPLP